MKEAGERLSSRPALILVSLGMAIGVGNIWRFPRVLAHFEGGGGTFLIPWAVFLFTWSIPLLATESAIGRRTRRGVVASLGAILGPERTWVGAFVATCTIAITCYYGVVAGWCVLYLIESARGTVLGLGVEEATQHFTAVAQGPSAALAMLFVLALAAWTVSHGIRRGVERATRLLLPPLFLLMIGMAVLGLRQEGASAGLAWMVRVDWPTLATPAPWLEALSQSAWSTGAGLGIVLVFSSAARHEGRVVEDAVITGAGNNLASLVAALCIVPAVFALASATAVGAAPIEILAHRGPGGTGLAMVWLPRLFAELGPAGRPLAVAFFAVLSLAALTSLIALLELFVRTLVELGPTRGRAARLAFGATALLGLPSALSLDLLVNQDWVWSVGLVVSGLLLALAAGRLGTHTFRAEWVRDGAGRRWEGRASLLGCVLRVLVPLQFAVLLGWWFHGSATSGEGSWLDPFAATSVGTCLAQWTLAFLVLLLLNRFLRRCVRPLPDRAQSEGASAARHQRASSPRR
jgi:NSS family neurotransmitter:Na+ symporter